MKNTIIGLLLLAGVLTLNSCDKKIRGCTDPTSTNYNAGANEDDGSCTYAPVLAIGQSYQGGIVAYILQPGDNGYDANIQHGLIAAPSNQGATAWGCLGTIISGADGTAVGTGNQNTIDILNGCSESLIAARKCGDLVLAGYSDWYLPSKDELLKLYENRIVIGGFSIGSYWSSTEYNNSEYSACYHFFNTTGNQGYTYKDETAYIRAVRAF